MPIGTDVPLVSRIVRYIKFDDLPSSEFDLEGNYKNIRLSDGILKLEEPIVSGDPWADGSLALISHFPVKTGNGYILLMRITEPGTQFFVTFEVGPFNDPSYRAFWFESGWRASIWSGRSQIIYRTLKTQFKIDTWYYLLMRLYAEGVEIRLWEKDHPENPYKLALKAGHEWASSDFIYQVGLSEGIIEIDEFHEVEFPVSEAEPLGK